MEVGDSYRSLLWVKQHLFPYVGISLYSMVDGWGRVANLLAQVHVACRTRGQEDGGCGAIHWWGGGGSIA